MAGFAAGPLIFTNLYYVHNYYLSATGIWLLLALSLAVVGLAEMWPARRWPRLAAMLLTLVVGGAGFWGLGGRVFADPAVVSHTCPTACSVDRTSPATRSISADAVDSG